MSWHVCPDCRTRELHSTQVRCDTCQLIREMESRMPPQAAKPGDLDYVPVNEADAARHKRVLKSKNFGNGQV